MNPHTTRPAHTAARGALRVGASWRKSGPGIRVRSGWARVDSSRRGIDASVSALKPAHALALCVADSLFAPAFTGL